MVLALHLVHERFGIKTIVVSTYQAVSGAGKSGIDELNDQMEGKISPKKFIRQIHLNVVPQIGALLDSGFTDEEMKLVDETRRILRDPEISIWPTAIRVPVYYGHSESIFVETRTSFDMSSLAEALDESETVRHTDDMVSPIEIAGSDESHVCRLRSFDDRRFLIWNVADNIRTGAATNAVRILMKHRELNRAG